MNIKQNNNMRVTTPKQHVKLFYQIEKKCWAKLYFFHTWKAEEIQDHYLV